MPVWPVWQRCIELGQAKSMATNKKDAPRCHSERQSLCQHTCLLWFAPVKRPKPSGDADLVRPASSVISLGVMVAAITSREVPYTWHAVHVTTWSGPYAFLYKHQSPNVNCEWAMQDMPEEGISSQSSRSRSASSTPQATRLHPRWVVGDRTCREQPLSGAIPVHRKNLPPPKGHFA
jgi:hypothetical protein